MRTYIFILCTAAIVIMSACSASIKNIKPGGDTAEIGLSNGKTLNAELLMVEDSSMFIFANLDAKSGEFSVKNIYSLPVKNISYIKIEDYSNDQWLTPLIIFQVIPPILFTIAAASADADITGAGYLILYGPAVITYFLFKGSQLPPPGAEYPLTSRDINDLKKYTRFPRGLLPEQFAALLTRFRQETPLQIE